MSEGKSHFDFESLPGRPVTRIEVGVKWRDRPAWRHRFHVRQPPWVVLAAGAAMAWGLLWAALVLALVIWC